MMQLMLLKNKGYGVVVPGLNDVKLSDPEIIKNGNKYGVKLKAESPSLHMIKVNIGTEISPIVGSKEQAEDLMAYIKESTKRRQCLGDQYFWQNHRKSC